MNDQVGNRQTQQHDSAGHVEDSLLVEHSRHAPCSDGDAMTHDMTGTDLTDSQLDHRFKYYVVR